MPVFERDHDRGHYVAISHADRHPKLHYEATIHHGIRMEEFPLVTTPGYYLLFFGRRSLHTRARPRRSMWPSTWVCCLRSPASCRTRSTSIGPWSRASTATACGTSVPSVPTSAGRAPGGARALLHLISFEEPFGFSAESSRWRAALPSFADAPRLDVRTCSGWGERLPGGWARYQAVAAIEVPERLERSAVRASVERRFDVSRMVQDYIDVYRRVAGRTTGP